MGNATTLPLGTRVKFLEAKNAKGLFTVQKSIPSTYQPSLCISTPATFASFLGDGSSYGKSSDSLCEVRCEASEYVEESKSILDQIDSNVQRIPHPTLLTWTVQPGSSSSASSGCVGTSDVCVLTELITNHIASSDLSNQSAVIALYLAPNALPNASDMLQQSSSSTNAFTPAQVLELLRLLSQRHDTSSPTNTSSIGTRSQLMESSKSIPFATFTTATLSASLYYWPGRQASQEVIVYSELVCKQVAQVFASCREHILAERLKLSVSQVLSEMNVSKSDEKLNNGTTSRQLAPVRGYTPLVLAVPVPVPPPSFQFAPTPNQIGGSGIGSQSRGIKLSINPNLESTSGSVLSAATRGGLPIATANTPSSSRSPSVDIDSVSQGLRSMVSDSPTHAGPFAHCPMIHELVDTLVPPNSSLRRLSNSSSTASPQNVTSSRAPTRITSPQPVRQSSQNQTHSQVYSQSSSQLISTTGVQITASKLATPGQESASEITPIRAQPAGPRGLSIETTSLDDASSLPVSSQPVPRPSRHHIRTPSVTLDLTALGGSAIEAPSEFDERTGHHVVPENRPSSGFFPPVSRFPSRPASALDTRIVTSSTASTPASTSTLQFGFQSGSQVPSLLIQPQPKHTELPLVASSPSSATSVSSRSIQQDTLNQTHISTTAIGNRPASAAEDVNQGSSMALDPRVIEISSQWSVDQDQDDIEEDENEVDARALLAELGAARVEFLKSQDIACSPDEVFSIPFLCRELSSQIQTDLIGSRVLIDPEVIQTEKLFKAFECPSSTTSASSSTMGVPNAASQGFSNFGSQTKRVIGSNSNSLFIANDDEEEALMRKNRKLQFYGKKCSRVLPFLYIGGRDVAESREILQAHGITHIINCAATVCKDVFEGIPDPYGDGSVKCIEYLDLPMLDSAHEDLLAVLYQVTRFILLARMANPSSRFLVHCQQGVSRSCAVCIGFLMLWFRISYDAAFAYIRRRRGVCRPNVGFMCQLISWYSRLSKPFTTPLIVDRTLETTPVPALLYRVSYAHASKPVGTVLTSASSPITSAASRRHSVPHVSRLPSFRIVDFADPLITTLQRNSGRFQSSHPSRSKEVPLQSMLDPRTSYLLCLPHVSLIALSQSDPRPDLLALHLLSLVEFEGASRKIGCLFLPPQGYCEENVIEMEEIQPSFDSTSLSTSTDVVLKQETKDAGEIQILLESNSNATQLVHDALASQERVSFNFISPSEAEWQFWSFVGNAGMTSTSPPPAYGPHCHGIVQRATTSNAVTVNRPKALVPRPVYNDEIKPYDPIPCIAEVPQHRIPSRLAQLASALTWEIIVPIMTASGITNQGDPSIYPSSQHPFLTPSLALALTPTLDVSSTPSKSHESSVQLAASATWSAARALSIALCRELVNSHIFGVLPDEPYSIEGNHVALREPTPHDENVECSSMSRGIQLLPPTVSTGATSNSNPVGVTSESENDSPANPPDSNRMHDPRLLCDIPSDDENSDVAQRRRLEHLFASAVQLYKDTEWSLPLDRFGSEDLATDGIFLLHRERPLWHEFRQFVESCDPDILDEFIINFEDENDEPVYLERRRDPSPRDEAQEYQETEESSVVYVPIHDLFVWVGKERDPDNDDALYAIANGIAAKFCEDFSLDPEQVQVHAERQDGESAEFWECFING